MNKFKNYYHYGGIENKLMSFRYANPNFLTKTHFRRFNSTREENNPQLIFAHTSWSKNCFECMGKLKSVLEKHDNFKIYLRKLDVEKDTQIHKIGNITCVPTLQIWSKKECKGELINPKDENEIEVFLQKHFQTENPSHQLQPSKESKRYSHLLYEAHSKQEWETLENLLYNDKNQDFVSNFIPEKHLFELSLSARNRDFTKIKEICSEILKYDIKDFPDEDLTHTIIFTVIILLNDIPSRKNLKNETLLRQIDTFQKGITSNTPTSINPKKYSYLGIGQLTPYDMIITKLLSQFISTQSAYSAYAHIPKFKNNIDNYSNDNNEQSDNNLFLTKLIISRLYLCLASRAFQNENFSEAFALTIKCYQQENELDLNENNPSHFNQTISPSMLMLQSMITILGNNHPSTIEARSQLNFITGNYKFHPQKLPFAKISRGGRPRMLRGKSGKWQWLGPEWKPPWVPKWKK